MFTFFVLMEILCCSPQGYDDEMDAFKVEEYEEEGEEEGEEEEEEGGEIEGEFA